MPVRCRGVLRHWLQCSSLKAAKYFSIQCHVGVSDLLLFTPCIWFLLENLYEMYGTWIFFRYNMYVHELYTIGYCSYPILSYILDMYT